ncbi:MAG: hypothetical protein R3B06_15495 [Kofleriaceae bacterium]
MTRTPGVLVLTTALGAFACGGADGGASDGGVDAAVPPPPGPACASGGEPTARFTVVPEPGAAMRIGSQAGGHVASGAMPRLLATLVTEGSCRFVGPRPALCEPGCTDGTVCDVDGVCAAFPVDLPAGVFTITGTTPPVSLEPRAGGYYSEQAYPGWFRPDDELTLSLAGADAVAPMTATVRGVPALTLPTTQLTATEHQPMVIRWDPIPTPTGAEVLVHFDNDHHGVSAYLECVAPAAAGMVTVPAAVLDPLIAAGETGIGTFIENAWIEVHHRVALDTPRGCAVFESYSDRFVTVDTVRAP